MNPIKQSFNKKLKPEIEFSKGNIWFSDDDNNIRQFSDMDTESFTGKGQYFNFENDKHYSLVNFEKSLNVNESFLVVDWQKFESF